MGTLYVQCNTVQCNTATRNCSVPLQPSQLLNEAHNSSTRGPRGTGASWGSWRRLDAQNAGPHVAQLLDRGLLGVVQVAQLILAGADASAGRELLAGL